MTRSVQHRLKHAASGGAWKAFTALAGSAAFAASFAGGPAAAQMTPTPAPIPSFTAVPYTATSEAFNHRIEQLASDGSGYTEMEFFITGTANLYKKDTTPQQNTIINTSNNPYTTRILVRLPANPAKFSGNVVMEIYNGTPGYDADVEWTQTENYLKRNGDAWVGITNGTGPANVLKADYGAYMTCGSSVTAPSPAPCVGALNRYAPINFGNAGYAWDMISQAGALLKTNPTGLLTGYTVKHLFAMAESGAAQSLVLYINDVHPYFTMADGSPIFDGFMPDERFGTGSSLAGGVAAWPTCSPRLVLNSTVPIANLETQPDLVASTAWCVRRANSNVPGNQYVSWELPGASHLTPFVTDDDNSRRDLLGTGFTFPTYGCTHGFTVINGQLTGSLGWVSLFPKEYFKQALLAALEQWVINGVAPPTTSPINLNTPATGTTATYVLDQFGNATGGLRTPMVDYPDRTWFPNDTTRTSNPTPAGPLATLYCSLYGYVAPFTATELQSLYANHSTYVKDVTNEANQLVIGRFLQTWNATTIKTSAAQSPVPTSAVTTDTEE